MINFSIIIPHYNSPTLLQRCLASIPDCEDIQVIVVDDCSDPKIVDFDTLPGRERQFTEVYRTPKGGSAGRARNVGLEHAKGKWLLFADADDFFMPSAFETISKYCDNKEDIIYFGITSVDSNTLESTQRWYTYGKYILQYDANPILENERFLRFRHDVPWGKMIKSGVIAQHNITFEETRWCNDTFFSTKTAYYANAITIANTPVYCVTDNTTSLTKQNSIEALFVRYNVQLQRNKFLREKGLNHYQISTLSYLKAALPFGIFIVCKLILIGIKAHNPFFIRFTYKFFKK